MRHDFDAAERSYRAVLGAEPEGRYGRAAAIDLAVIAWRVRGDTAAANGFLDDAAPATAVSLARGRMRVAAHNYPGARRAAEKAMGLAETASDTARVAGLLAESLIDPILDRMDATQGSWEVSDEVVATLRATVVPRLRRAVAEAPGVLKPARLLVLAALVAGDGPAALAGWHSYYLIGTTGSDVLAGAGAALDTLLPNWSGYEGSGAVRTALVQALGASRSFDGAALVARLGNVDDARAGELTAYARFLRRVKALADEAYRKTALGKGPDVDALRDGILALAAGLWPHLQWRGRPDSLSWDHLGTVLEAKFGAFFTLGLTSGYPSLHMGHTVVDDRRVVRQYGRRAEVRFVSLDAIASNGFESWAWDGRAETGGWGTTGEIVQIRPAYVEGPLAEWAAVSSPAARARAVERMAADSAADVERARAEPVAFFPSVAERLQRDGRMQIVDALRAAGHEGADLEAAFKREYARAALESSVFAHEGRHVIDQQENPGLGSEELEFRAKCSQVVFAAYPRLAAVSGIIQANIGDGSPHGEANRRIMEGLRTWMRAHAREVRGLVPGDPLLPQLPLLSDAQLRAAFASMDPMADAGPSGTF